MYPLTLSPWRSFWAFSLKVENTYLLKKTFFIQNPWTSSQLLRDFKFFFFFLEFSVVFALLKLLFWLMVLFNLLALSSWKPTGDRTEGVTPAGSKDIQMIPVPQIGG